MYPVYPVPLWAPTHLAASSTCVAGIRGTLGVLLLIPLATPTCGSLTGGVSSTRLKGTGLTPLPRSLPRLQPRTADVGEME